MLHALSSSLSGPSGGCLAEIRRKFRAGVTSGQCCQWTAWVPEPSPNWWVDLCGQVPTTHILDSRKRSNWWGAQLPVPVVHSFLRTSFKSFGFTKHVDKAQFVNQVPILTAMILQGHVHAESPRSHRCEEWLNSWEVHSVHFRTFGNRLGCTMSFRSVYFDQSERCSLACDLEHCKPP